MLDFFAQNLATIVVALVMIGIVAAVFLKIHRDKKKGKSSCGCNCNCCGNNSVCHSKETAHTVS